MDLQGSWHSKALTNPIIWYNITSSNAVIFSSIGHFFQWFSGQPSTAESPVFHVLIKLPAILADLLLAIILFFLTRQWKGRVTGFLAAAAFISQPFRVRLPALFLSAATCAFAFFLFNTEMHERYLFPFVALGLPVAFLGLRAASLYAAISFLFFLNLLGWLPYGSLDRAIFRAFPTLDVAIGTTQVICFLFWISLLFNFRSRASGTEL